MSYAAESLRAGKWVDIRRYRDVLFAILGTALLASQAISFVLTGETDPALVTAGTSLLVSPLVLKGDEKK